MDFNLPTLTTGYAEFLAQMKERDEAVIKMLDGITASNIPSGAKRWNSDGSKWEKYNGTEWSNLATLYEIKVRDSDKLNGQTANYYAVANHGHSNATTTTNGFMSSTDKTKLDSVDSNANNYSHPTGEGNLHVPANGTANNGKFLQATAVAGTYVWASPPTSSLSTLGITATAAELNFVDGVTSNVQTQLNAKAPLASPALTGTPTAPTAAVGTNTTQLATTAFVLANSAVVTATTVGGATAELAAGAVGSYVSGIILNGSTLVFGATIAANNIRVTNSAGGSLTTLAGTWRFLGTAYPSNYHLFLRIA